VLRAVEGPEAAGPHTEEIVVGPRATAFEAANEFLMACGVRQAPAANALDEAAARVAAGGEAIVVASFSDAEPHLAVEPRTEKLLRTSGIAESVATYTV